MKRGFSSVTAQLRSTLQSVSGPDNTTASKSLHSDKRQRFSVKALHDSLHFLKGDMMEIINAVWERSTVGVAVCVLLLHPPSQNKWKRHHCPQMSNALGAREWKQLGQFHQRTQALSHSLKMARGENRREPVDVVPSGGAGWVPFRRERKLNGPPLRTHSLFTCWRETNHVGTNKNAAQRKEETEYMKERNQSRQKGKEELSFMVAEDDGVQQGIPGSNGGLTFEEEDHLWVLVLF